MEASEQTPTQEQPQTTDDLLRAVLAEQQAHRAEVAELREQLAASRPAAQPAAPVANLSPEEAMEARMKDIGEHDYYCPGCGLLYKYQQRCTGRAESGHAPIEVVSTDELKSGDTSKHTAPVYVQ